MTRPLHIIGMHGMGDNLHQRAIIRQLIETRDVWLETPWPSIYHDMVGPRLHLVDKGSPLRTQAKNAKREANLYSSVRVPANAETMRISYTPADVRATRSVLGAMSKCCGVPVADFRMPVPSEWMEAAHGVPLTDRPIIIYRPLMDRSEWGGCRARNPDYQIYAETLAFARERLDAYVISVADLEPNREWLVGPQPEVDLKIHDGGLSFRELAVLWSYADLIVSSPGFGIVLAQAVSTPSIAVFGGYEGDYSFDAGARYTPTLTIGEGCDCFSHHHNCDKRVDMLNHVSGMHEFFASEVTA